MLLCYEVTRDLPLETIEIETPLAHDEGAADRRQEAGVRADPARRHRLARRHARPGAGRARRAISGSTAIRRRFARSSISSRRPTDIAERLVIVVEPMLATGNSAVAAIDRLKERGASDITLRLPARARPRASRRCAAHPDVPIWTAAIDERLDEHGYIMPGLGDAGDRALRHEVAPPLLRREHKRSLPIRAAPMSRTTAASFSASLDRCTSMIAGHEFRTSTEFELDSGVSLESHASGEI